jgi:hypothetical protein
LLEEVQALVNWQTQNLVEQSLRGHRLNLGERDV